MVAPGLIIIRQAHVNLVVPIYYFNNEMSEILCIIAYLQC